MVVAVGLTIVEPLADVDVNDPGVMETLVAPRVPQLSWLLPPELIVVGLAVKEPIVGAAALAGAAIDGVVEPQPASKAQADKMNKFRLRFSANDLSFAELDLLLEEEIVAKIWLPFNS